MIGRDAEILIEKITQKGGREIAEGYTANYIRTFADLDGRNISRGDIVKGVIFGAENENCTLRFP